jgi:hypothetical protein
MVVVHINSTTMILDERDLPNNVWINPEHVITDRSTLGLLLGFVSNIEYGYQKATFDRVLFLSSSCFFFRPLNFQRLPLNGVWCSPCTIPLSPVIKEPWIGLIWKDQALMAYLEAEKSPFVYNGLLSGTILPQAAVADLVALTRKSALTLCEQYPCEEVYPQTIGRLYALRNNSPLLPEVMFTNRRTKETYFCEDESVFEEARQSFFRYGMLKIDHFLENPALMRLKDLQEGIAGGHIPDATIFCSGSREMLSCFLNGRDVVEPIHAFMDPSPPYTMTEGGTNFMGFFTTSRQHLQFLRLIHDGEATLDCFPYFTSDKIKNIRERYDDCRFFFFEISSMMLRCKKGRCVAEGKNYTLVQHQSEEELYQELLALASLLPEGCKRMILWVPSQTQRSNPKIAQVLQRFCDAEARAAVFVPKAAATEEETFFMATTKFC